MTLPNFKPLGKSLLILLLAVLLYLLAAVLAGAVSALSTNVDMTSVAIIFDPQLTIAYLLIYFATNHFYRFSSRGSYSYLILAIALSFTTNFIQGVIFMLILPPLLRKLKLLPLSPSANTNS